MSPKGISCPWCGIIDMKLRVLKTVRVRGKKIRKYRCSSCKQTFQSVEHSEAVAFDKSEHPRFVNPELAAAAGVPVGVPLLMDGKGYVPMMRKVECKEES